MTRSREEAVLDEEGDGVSPMPIVGEKIMVLGHSYRCVSVSYADTDETKSLPELRVRYRLIAPSPGTT